MTSQRDFVTLDGLRGIAALAVVTRHAPDFFQSISILIQPADLTKPAISVGPFFESYLAVDFFFVLSGFVLAHSYGERLSAGMSSARFMILRYIRLYPLYFLGLLITSACVLEQFVSAKLSPATFDFGCISFAFGLFMLPSPASGFVLFPLNSPTWSLFFELYANWCYALIGRHLRTGRLAVFVGSVAIGMFFAVNRGWLGFGSAEIGALDDGFEWQGVGAGLLRVLYSFFAGVLVFRIWKASHLRIDVHPIFIMGALVAVLAANPSKEYWVAFDLAATLIVFPGLVFVGASSVPSRPMARLFLCLGAASYGVYVLQVPIYEVLVGYLRGTGGEMHWIWAPLFVTVVLSLAAVADKYIDKPIRTALSRLLLASPALRARRCFKCGGRSSCCGWPARLGARISYFPNRRASGGTASSSGAALTNDTSGLADPPAGRQRENP